MDEFSLAEIKNLLDWLACHKTGLSLVISEVVNDLFDLLPIVFNHGLKVLLLSSDARARVLTYFE